MPTILRVIDLYRDREYFRQLLKIGLPITFQQFVFSLLNMVGVVMIGQKGEVAVAASPSHSVTPSFCAAPGMSKCRWRSAFLH
ncbi:MAG: hypothetical protein COY47_06740 [Chloroflexi bacterium CG_4_10_14_0_8_um_filter_57_5]|nr:MAG: hypothetical protein COY47_06740 [Chloroflexi bacterium CG_4_10_14_0_8_um_filter_57_5]PJH76283.1 MAG: hypothetical protein CO064_02090 [Anaerolineae bacterium CG_4_9_14_0_8_um_filter_58_9]